MCKIRRCSAAAEAYTLPSSVAVPLNIYSWMGEDQGSTFIPQDIIVSEILPRLHVKSLYKFKCISKRYQSIISDPKFARNYLQRASSSPESSSSSGLLVSLLFPITCLSSHNRDGLSKNVKDLTDTIDSSTPYPDDQLSIRVSTVSLSYDVRDSIRACSGGLILYCIYPDCDLDIWRFALCVSNPLTKQCVRLPDPTGTEYYKLEFCIATRCDQGAAFLTYKIVMIHHDFLAVDRDGYENTTVEIFSSDTGIWAAWKARCPKEIFNHTTRRTSFAYKGILHWLDLAKDTVITYDPYDNPHRFGRICLPQGKYSNLGSKKNTNKSLIYSGEEEMVKYCEIGKCGSGVDDVLSVWRLIDCSEWCLEGEFSVPSLLYGCERLMVAPYPWNRNVICHPFVIYKKVTTINPWAGTRKLVDVFSETAQAGEFYHKSFSYGSKLVPIELCPWSSPFYVKAS